MSVAVTTVPPLIRMLMDFCLWSLVFGLWSLVFRLWSFVFGYGCCAVTRGELKSKDQHQRLKSKDQVALKAAARPCPRTSPAGDRDRTARRAGPPRSCRGPVPP